jgi:RNase P subunit RPR2
MARNRRFDEILKDYSDKYDLATLSSPNDKANLEMLINNQIIVESVQAKLQELTQDDPVDNIDMIQRLSSSLKDIIERNLQLERALALDRKTRNQNSSESVAEYIVSLKQTAMEFLEKRLIRLYCPNCKILLARFSIMHDHSSFQLKVNCNQCNKYVTAEREERDIFFDIKDSGWRRKHKYAVKNARLSGSSSSDVEDDIVLGDDDEEEEQSDAQSED